MNGESLGELHSIHLYPGTVTTSRSQSRELPSISNQELLRNRFYERYRKEAEEYDGEFMKKYDEDLNTTIIFVRIPKLI